MCLVSRCLSSPACLLSGLALGSYTPFKGPWPVVLVIHPLRGGLGGVVPSALGVLAVVLSPSSPSPSPVVLLPLLLLFL